MYGSKFHSLDELSQLGINTPISYGVSCDLQKKFFDDNGLSDDVEKILISGKSPYTFILQHFKSNKAVFPAELAGVFTEIKQLFGDGSEVTLARSSAEIEDGEKTSFAGMFESIAFDLNSENDFIKAILGVWLSAIRQPVVDYLVTSNNSHLLPLLTSTMNVMLQPGLNAQCAGVLFSKYSQNDNFARSYVTYGLGDLINTCNFHQCELIEDISRHEFAVYDMVRVRQAIVFSPLKSKVIQVISTIFGKCVSVARYRPHMYKVRLPKDKVFWPAANSEVRNQLYDVFHAVLNLRNGERDFELEWLFANGRIYIVQIRPITAFESVGFETKDMKPIVSGKLDGPIVRWAGRNQDYIKKLIMVNDLTYDLISVLKDCSGVLTLSGTPHSHAAIICRELGVPVYKVSKDQYASLSRGGYYMQSNELRSEYD
jgi:phosphoenolpyruvate synthase/pyruvate phosphate dikinase